MRPPMWRQLDDDLARRLLLAAPPQRIVSLVPSLTELVCALGCAERLVGVTRYCTDPPEVVAAVQRVGGTKNPDLDRILRLAPDLVLVNSEENRHEDFQGLSAAGLSLFVSFPRTLEAVAGSVVRLAAALGAETAAASMVIEIEEARQSVPLRRARVFCPIWRKPWMSFNRDTYGHDLLLCAGGENVCAGYGERYPIVDLAAVAQADPEVVLLPSEPYPFGERHRGLLGALDDTATGRTGRIHLVDGRDLFWYGPRTAPAVRTLRRLLA